MSGTISCCINYASKHSSETLDVVLLVGRNDLSNRSVSPEKLINTLDSSLKELKQFNNVHHVFLCKIPPRFDFHNVNIKVNQYNNILSERFSDSELTVPIYSMTYCYCAESDTVFQHRTLSRTVRHCQTRGSSISFDTVSPYHTVSCAGKLYHTVFYESVLIFTILNHIVKC